MCISVTSIFLPVGGDAHERTLVGARKRAAQHDPVAIHHDLVHLVAVIRESRRDHPDGALHLFWAEWHRHEPRVVVGGVLGDEFLGEPQIPLVPQLVVDAADRPRVLFGRHAPFLAFHAVFVLDGRKDRTGVVWHTWQKPAISLRARKLAQIVILRDAPGPVDGLSCAH